MNLTKKQCKQSLNNLYNGNYYEKHDYSKDYDLLMHLIDEHFDNPPLTFEELHEDMWVWDDKYKEWRKIHTIYILNLRDIIEFEDGEYIVLTSKYFFEENRFYRKRVNDDE